MTVITVPSIIRQAKVIITPMKPPDRIVSISELRRSTVKGDYRPVAETVCNRTITGDPACYPQAEFHGRTIHFCTEICQSVFLSDPERFYAAHSKRRS